MKKRNTFTFSGFEPANTTPVPDILFDDLLSELSGSELKVLLYIIRRTKGFKKDTDAISLTQFQKGITTKDGKVLDKGCGIDDRQTIIKALNSLEEKKCIISEKSKTANGDNAVTVYRIYFNQQVVGKTNQGSREKQPPWLEMSTTVVGNVNYGVVGKSNPQETVLQDTVKQETVLQKQHEENVHILNVANGGVYVASALSEKKERSEYEHPREPIPFPQQPPPEKQQTSSPKTEKRKPDKPKQDTALQTRINEVYDTFDKLLQEVSNDPDARYSRTKAATEAIKEFLNCKPTSEKLRLVYMDLWNSPPGQNGFSWRDNMSIAAICRNYDKRLLALRGKQQKSEQPKATVTGEADFTPKEPRRSYRMMRK